MALTKFFLLVINVTWLTEIMNMDLPDFLFNFLWIPLFIKILYTEIYEFWELVT